MIWYREITRDQRRAFVAAYLAWVLDGFDFYILTFLLTDIQRAFSVTNALAGALGTVTLMFRVVGGIGAGAAADRWGRKRPLMFSIVWYSTLACLSGFSTSYGMLFALRALFGVGMGGVWAAGVPLTIEHWPAHLRGTASGLLQGGYSVGIILSALVYQLVYPLMTPYGDFGWRAMLWIGVLPALLVVWIVRRVPESPIWLERQSTLRARREREGFPLARLISPALRLTVLQTSLLMGAFLFSNQSITFWYARFLASIHREPLPFLLALNAGGIAGAALWGKVSEGRLGRRGALSLAMAVGVAATPLYLFAATGLGLWIGALIVGVFAAGCLGIMPGYLSERFPTEARAVGAGFAYHVGAGLGSFTPYMVGALQDRGVPLTTAMATCIVLSGLLVIVSVWLGPETRGRALRSA